MPEVSSLGGIDESVYVRNMSTVFSYKPDMSVSNLALAFGLGFDVRISPCCRVFALFVMISSIGTIRFLLFLVCYNCVRVSIASLLSIRSSISSGLISSLFSIRQHTMMRTTSTIIIRAPDPNIMNKVKVLLLDVSSFSTTATHSMF